MSCPFDQEDRDPSNGSGFDSPAGDYRKDTIQSRKRAAGAESAAGRFMERRLAGCDVCRRAVDRPPDRSEEASAIPA